MTLRTGLLHLPPIHPKQASTNSHDLAEVVRLEEYSKGGQYQSEAGIDLTWEEPPALDENNKDEFGNSIGERIFKPQESGPGKRPGDDDLPPGPPAKRPRFAAISQGTIPQDTITPDSLASLIQHLHDYSLELIEDVNTRKMDTISSQDRNDSDMMLRKTEDWVLFTPMDYNICVEATGADE